MNRTLRVGAIYFWAAVLSRFFCPVRFSGGVCLCVFLVGVKETAKTTSFFGFKYKYIYIFIFTFTCRNNPI